MSRVGRLEAGVEQLSRQLENVGLRRDTESLAARDGAAPQMQPPDAAQSDQSAEIEAMRLQLNNLASQLATAEAELGKLTGRRPRRHYRARVPTPLWRKVLRRLGIE